MAVYLSTKFATPKDFEDWVEKNEHKNKGFLDNLCEEDKKRWDKKACKMTVKDGKLQLLCEDGNVLAEADYYSPDNDTVSCGGDGSLCVHGIKNANDPNGKKFRMWVGTNAEYIAIRVKDANTYYWITDDATFDEVVEAINNLNDGFKELEEALENGEFVVAKAKKATNADNATNANKAKTADTAGTITSILPISKGGTGANKVNNAKRNLGIPISIYCGNSNATDVNGEGWYKVFEIPCASWVIYTLNITIDSGNYSNLYNVSPVNITIKVGSNGTSKYDPAVWVNSGKEKILEYFYLVQDTENYNSGSYELWYKNPTAYQLAHLTIHEQVSRYQSTDFSMLTIGDCIVAHDSYTSGKTAYPLSDCTHRNMNIVPIELGGTGAYSAAKARENLGVPATADLTSGAITVKNATNADSAKKATTDEHENNIYESYALKCQGYLPFNGQAIINHGSILVYYQPKNDGVLYIGKTVASGTWALEDVGEAPYAKPYGYGGAAYKINNDGIVLGRISSDDYGHFYLVQVQ